MTTVIATIVVLGILVFVHEFGHFLLAKLLGVRVDAFSLGFPPKLVSKKIGETEYRLSVIPLGGYVKLLGENPDEEVPPELEPRSFSHHPLWHRALIVLAGPGFNLLFCILVLFLLFSVSGIPYVTTTIGEVKPDSPAAVAGLQQGDRVLTVEGKKVERWDQLSSLIRGHGEQPLTISIQRGPEVVEIHLSPQRMETTNIFGQKVSAVLIGIGSANDVVVERVGIFPAFGMGVAYTYQVALLTVVSIYKLIAQEIPVNTLGGPILIAQVAGQRAEQGAPYLLHFMAILSVNLALLNLLPIPILDGGHMVFILWEAIRGKPLAVKHREMAQAMGLMLILALMVLVFYQDLMRLFAPSN
jgi:regulator of sigma E protease